MQIAPVQDLTSIKALKSFSVAGGATYNQGEVAGFPEMMAQNLVELGYAEPVETAEAPTTDPEPELPKEAEAVHTNAVEDAPNKMMNPNPPERPRHWIERPKIKLK